MIPTISSESILPNVHSASPKSNINVKISSTYSFSQPSVQTFTGNVARCSHRTRPRGNNRPVLNANLFIIFFISILTNPALSFYCRHQIPHQHLKQPLMPVSNSYFSPSQARELKMQPRSTLLGASSSSRTLVIHPADCTNTYTLHLSEIYSRHTDQH